MAAYHERFAAVLSDVLPEGFTVHADRSIVAAEYGTARLVGFVPAGSDIDKRKPVTVDDAEVWLARAMASLRRDLYHYTPAANEAGNALLNALTREEV